MRLVVEDHLDESQAHAHALIDRVLADGAADVTEDAQRYAPVGDTGILRSSIRAERGEGRHEWTVFTDVFYADWVEYGTGIYREADAPGGPGRQSPWVYYWPERNRFVWTQGNMHQPFARPAYERNYQRIIRNMQKAVGTL